MNDRPKNIFEDPLSVLFTWYDFTIFLLMFPSNSVLVFFRNNLGYRLMRPWMFWVTAIGLFIAGGYEQSPGAIYAQSQGLSPLWSYLPLDIYIVAMGVLAFINRRTGWNLVFRDPDPIHTMSRGDSYLSKVLPFVPEWIMHRWLEPAIIYVIGLVFAFVFHWGMLGTWIMIGGGGLACIEALNIEKAINSFLDVRDSKIEAVAMQALDDAASGKGQDEPQAKIGGLATASPELIRLRTSRVKSLETSSTTPA
jgi:hypothetical protein